MENTIVLTEAERIELNQRATSRSGRADDARCARMLLLLEAGCTWASRHAGQEASTLTPTLEARILEWTLKLTPPDEATQWSTRRL